MPTMKGNKIMTYRSIYLLNFSKLSLFFIVKWRKILETNQEMIVKIGDGNIRIGHLTQMGKLNDIFEIGNRYRIRENKKTKV